MRRLSAKRKKHRHFGLRPATDAGASQIEFILTIITVLFVIFFIWEVIMAIYTANVLAEAAKEGVRYAIVHGSGSTLCSGPNPPASCTSPDPSATNVTNTALSYARLSFHDISAISVNVTYPDGNIDPPGRVRVEITYNFVPYTALPIRPRLRAAAEGRIVF